MFIGIQYYQRPFLLFHKKLQQSPKTTSRTLRSTFWALIPNGIYSDIKAQELFWAYSNSLEKRAENIIKKYSIAYWLHLTRRIGVSSGGENKSASTIFVNRFNILALIQKYGMKSSCNSVANSKEVPLDKILNGLLLGNEFELERLVITEGPAQLVFTDFTHLNLAEYYELEKLAYELWLCGAKLRAIGKGARILVNNKTENYFNEERNQELDKLILSYDSRLIHEGASEVGINFSKKAIEPLKDILIPILNTSGTSMDFLNPILEKSLGIKLDKTSNSSFILAVFSANEFINSHSPFEVDFNQKYGLNFKHIVYTLVALCYRFLHLTLVEKAPNLVNILMRGYDGPSEADLIVSEVFNINKFLSNELGFETMTEAEISQVFSFLELVNQQDINIHDFGTLKLFCPIGKSHYYIDYSTIPVILNNLFNNIPLKNHDFRGYILEQAIGIKPYLPTTPCKSTNGSMKQIDFSYLIDGVLILGECKVVARRRSFFNGSFSSIRLRETKVVEKGLSHVDDKAKWLAVNRIGTNYNISSVKYILPIAISPFVEYIHSTEKKYWLNKTLPRVLSLKEFVELINTFDVNKIKYNLIELQTNNDQVASNN